MYICKSFKNWCQVYVWLLYEEIKLTYVFFSDQIINILCINLRHSLAQYKEEFSGISAAHRCDSHFVNYYKYDK